MGATNDRYRELLGRVSSTERLQFFSDAVFAIALTLLVLDIAVPELGQAATNGDINQALVDLVPKFWAYLLSFGVIAVNWAGHHRKFAVTRDFDGVVVWIDLLLLFLVAFLPFPTALFSTYPGYTSPVILYAVIVSGISLVQYWLWSYTYRKGFLHESIDISIYRMIRRNLLVVPVVFLVSVPVALLPFDGSGFAAMYVWILTAPVSVIAAREALWERRRGSSAEASGADKG